VPVARLTRAQAKCKPIGRPEAQIAGSGALWNVIRCVVLCGIACGFEIADAGEFAAGLSPSTLRARVRATTMGFEPEREVAR
jgi:hypothetical protein